jgi:hypothetical protein
MNDVIAPKHTDWIQTFMGRQFWPLEPRAEDIDIKDIAHALSNLCRYGGHTEQFYSVAQHCVLVSNAVPAEFALYGLLHDASEAYLIDVPRPIKHAEGMHAYRRAEARLEEVIYESFGLPRLGMEGLGHLKTADNQLLRTEQRDLMKPAPAEWKDYRVGALKLVIEPLLPHAAEQAYINRFKELTDGEYPQ